MDKIQLYRECPECGSKYYGTIYCPMCSPMRKRWIRKSSDEEEYEEPCWCDGCGRVLKCGQPGREYDCPASPNLGKNMI